MIAIRGAICAENTPQSIESHAAELLTEIFKANDLNIEDIIAITFTCTKDLNAAYPARAARAMGLAYASLMCVQEMDVQNSLQKCIRVQVLAQKDARQNEAKHIYLGAVKALRPDLEETP
ncbi:MAG: chorismate mutase [Defluviitaleaceae bacterium]|nr:chorismate mutase [Defluviitaleaceae bacterium]